MARVAPSEEQVFTSTRARLGLVLFAVAVGVCGCQSAPRTLRDAFPRAGVAAPWRASSDPWCGSLAEAANALGSDADSWRSPPPRQVWLATYTFEQDLERRLIVRTFVYEHPEGAVLAFEKHRPPSSRQFKAGDDGCWTPDGVLFRWGRLVFDVFGVTGNHRVVPEQVIVLVGRLEHQMPPDVPENPR